MSRYKTINGIRYSNKLLQLAEEGSGGEKKQSIKLATVKKMLEVLKSDNRYSALEKRTIGYIRANFTFSDEANTHLRSEVRSWTGIELKETSSSTTASTSDTTETKTTETSKTQQFTEFVNEETGEVFSTILEWGQSLPKSWGGIENYLYEHPGCKYLVEVLDWGTTVDSMQDYKRGYECNRYMYRGYDGKIYGFYVTEYVMEYTECTDFQEFEIKETKVYTAGPKGFKNGDLYRHYSSKIE